MSDYWDKQHGQESQETALTPGGHQSFEIPGEPDLPKCPTCKIGVLYTIAYDPDALHEHQAVGREGDPKGHGHFVASGGSIRLKCFNCETTQTQALNPDSAELAEAKAAADAARRLEEMTARQG